VSLGMILLFSDCHRRASFPFWPLLAWFSPRYFSVFQRLCISPTPRFQAGSVNPLFFSYLEAVTPASCPLYASALLLGCRSVIICDVRSVTQLPFSILSHQAPPSPLGHGNFSRFCTESLRLRSPFSHFFQPPRFSPLPPSSP